MSHVILAQGDADIRNLGAGRFSHWTDGATESLYFSASNNSDPRRNGRSYSYCIGTAPADTTAPSTPIGLSASAVSSSQINLSSQASTDNVGVTAYKVYRNGTLIATLSNVTSYSNTELTASTTYSYTVQACDAMGNCSAQSAAATATTPGLPAINGSCGTANGIPSVVASSSGLCNSGAASAVASNTTQWTWTCAGSAGGTNASCSAPRIDIQPSTVPTGLNATAVSTSQINLAWTTSTDNVGVTGYKVFRNGTQLTTVAGTSYANTGLTA